MNEHASNIQLCSSVTDQARAWEHAGRWDDAGALLRAVLPAADSPELEARVLTALAHVRNQQDWFQGPSGAEDKTAALDRLEALADERDDVRLASDVLYERALALHTLHFHGEGDLEAEQDLFQRSLDKRRNSGDEEGVAWALVYLGTLCQIREDHAAALPLFEEAAEIARRLEVPMLLSYVTRHLGMIHQEQGAWEAAHEAYTESLTIREAGGWTPYVATANHAIGSSLIARGETDRARAYLERAREIGEQVGITFMMGFILKDLAALDAG
jgi:tetratricopeptide (TPR) repeat protein